jgi:magnesium chelatase family protein
VVAARARQLSRAGKTNALLAQAETERDCRLCDRGQSLLEASMARLMLSARATQRILRVARTIADLNSAEAIGLAHLGEAISYRQLDRGQAPALPGGTHRVAAA